MNAPTLFDAATDEPTAEVIDFPRPVARNTDPDTSHAAAASVRNVTETHRRVLELLERFGSASDGDLLIYWRQMDSLEGWGPISTSGLRTRRAELVALGLVEDSGERSTTETGRACIVWQAVGVL